SAPNRTPAPVATICPVPLPICDPNSPPAAAPPAVPIACPVVTLLSWQAASASGAATSATAIFFKSTSILSAILSAVEAITSGSGAGSVRAAAALQRGFSVLAHSSYAASVASFGG